MKTFIFNLTLAIVGLTIIGAGHAGAADGPVATMTAGGLAAGKNTTIRPADTGAILVNPGMGWVFHHYDNSLQAYGIRLEPWDTVDDFPGVSVIYLRLAWEFIEPEEGKFNWSIAS